MLQNTVDTPHLKKRGLELNDTNPKYTRPDKIAWRPHEDDLILNQWGLGMDELKKRIGRSTSDIFGRRVYLLKQNRYHKL